MATATTNGGKGNKKFSPKPGTVPGAKMLKGEPEIPGIKIATKGMVAVISKVGKQKSKKVAVSMATKKKSGR